MRIRNHPAKRDKNHGELVKAFKSRCGGYYRDENGTHHANLMGLCVDAYDMHRTGAGFPDWLVFVSWMAVAIEIKNPDGRTRGAEQTQAGTLRAGYYTDDEIAFMRGFHGVRRTCTEQNEIYDVLCQVARFVSDADDLLGAKLSPDYLKLFFPRVMLSGETILPELAE